MKVLKGGVYRIRDTSKGKGWSEDFHSRELDELFSLKKG
jgi:hypothetical protein